MLTGHLTFGRVVRDARTLQGIAQKTLAQLAGIERSHMGKIERGEYTPNLIEIHKIARALSCSSGDLLTATENILASTQNSSKQLMDSQSVS